MEAELHPILRLLQGINAIRNAVASLGLLGIGIAFVVMGNTPGRLIGIAWVVLWLYFTVRALRRFANRIANPS